MTRIPSSRYSSRKTFRQIGHEVTSVRMPCLRKSCVLYSIMRRAESVSPESLSGRPQQTPPLRSAHHTSSPAAMKMRSMAVIVRGVSSVMQPAK